MAGLDRDPYDGAVQLDLGPAHHLAIPPARVVQLRGSSIAEFHDSRIAAFRHYFDDSEMLQRRARRVPAHLRWSSALLEQLRGDLERPSAPFPGGGGPVRSPARR